MNGHTPGPWTWSKRDIEGIPFGGVHQCVDAADGSSICAVMTDRDADFRLIAAAPDLLAALQRLWMWTAGEIPADATLGRRVREAIAKATGETS